MLAASGFKPARMRGGMMRGPGTGTSDSIPTKLPVGSYVVPADSTRSINVSNGEAALTPEQVKAVGTAALEAVRSVTHKPVRQAKGFKSKYADGGTIDFVRDAANQVADAARKGNYSDAAGQALRGALALPGVALGSAGADAFNGVVKPVGNALYTAATGNNTATLPASPVAPTAPAGPTATTVPTTGFRPGDDSRAAETQPATPIPALNGASGTTVQGAPGVFKFKQGGKTLYSNVAGPDNDTLMSKTPGVQVAPSALGFAPATNPAPVQAVADQPGALSNGSGAIVIGGPNASFFRQVGATGSAAQAETPSLSTLGAGTVSGREQARLANAAAIAAGQNATSRANTQANVAEQKYATDTGFLTNQQRLALDQQNATYTNAHAAAQTGQAATATQQAQAVLAARMQYAKALQSGDQKTIDAAESNLRGQEGRWERNYPELYKTTALPATINPDGSRSPGGAIVTDARTGETRIIYGKDTQAPETGALPPGLVVGAATKQADGTYTAAGKTITIKGGKVTAIQ